MQDLPGDNIQKRGKGSGLTVYGYRRLKHLPEGWGAGACKWDESESRDVASWGILRIRRVGAHVPAPGRNTAGAAAPAGVPKARVRPPTFVYHSGTVALCGQEALRRITVSGFRR